MNSASKHVVFQGAQEAPVRERTAPSASFGERRRDVSPRAFEMRDCHSWQPSQFEDIRLRRPESGSKQGVGSRRNVREYTLGEEVANSISHGLGVVLAIVAIPTTIVAAVVDHGGGIALAAALIYSISMLLEYTASTLYHALAHPGAKKVFKVIDHSCIYLFIAGTYTPFCLVTLIDSGGIILCSVVWVLAVVGIATEAFWVFRPRWVSAVIYLALGWCVVWFLPALVEALPLPGLVLLAAGGLSYSIGCVFYVLKKIPYMHTVFHVFVLAASILQYLSVVLYAL